MKNYNEIEVMGNETKQTELLTTFKMINENGSGSYSDFFDEFYSSVKHYGTVFLSAGVMEICGFAKQSSLAEYYNENSEHYDILCELGMTLVKPKNFIDTCKQFTKTEETVFVNNQEVLVELPALVSSTRQNATFEWYGDEIVISNRGMYIFTMESVVKLGMLSGTEKGKEFTKNFISYTKRCEAGMKAGQDFAIASANMVNNLEEKEIYIYSLMDPEVFEEYIVAKTKVKALQYTDEYYKAAMEELAEVSTKLEKRRRELNKEMDEAITDFQYNKLELERTTVVSNIKMIDNLKFKLSQQHQRLTNSCKVKQSNQTLLLKDIIEEYKSLSTTNIKTTFFKSESSTYDKLVKEKILENQKNDKKVATGNKIPTEDFDWMYGTVGTFQKRDKYGCQTPRFGEFGKDYLIYVMTAIDNNNHYETELNKVEAILYGGK